MRNPSDPATLGDIENLQKEIASLKEMIEALLQPKKATQNILEKVVKAHYPAHFIKAIKQYREEIREIGGGDVSLIGAKKTIEDAFEAEARKHYDVPEITKHIVTEKLYEWNTEVKSIDNYEVSLAATELRNAVEGLATTNSEKLIRMELQRRGKLTPDLILR